MFEDLREFIKRAEELNQVKLIENADWNLEIGRITELGQTVPNVPLLLFDKIKGYKAGYRVVTNFVANDILVALLFELPLDLKGSDLVKALRDKIFKQEFKPVPPVEIKRGPVMENIHTGNEVDLFEFPTPKWHELDGGRYIGTADLVIQRDPDEGWINLGTYRTEIQDKNTATIFMSPGKHGDIIRRKYWNRGLSCPVAVVCGVEPMLWSEGSRARPWGTSEYDYAGWLNNKPVEVVRGKTTDLLIPAWAEIVLEGEILPPGTDDRLEGPFGEYTGYYASVATDMPAFKVNCIMHRNNPILAGAPPEGSFLGENTVPSASLWRELDKYIQGIKGVRIVNDAKLGMVVISLKQMYAGHAKSAALCAAGLRTQSEALRWIIVVDDDIEPFNTGEVLWALGQRSDPEQSIDIIRGLTANELNPMVPPDKRSIRNFNHSRAIVLACKPYDWIEKFPIAIRSSREAIKETEKKWGKLLYGQA